MKITSILFILVLLLNTCRHIPPDWNGTKLTQPRALLTVNQLHKDSVFRFLDMEYFAKPRWANNANTGFCGTITINETKLQYYKEKEYYPGENIFPNLQLDFISLNSALIPRIKQKIITKHQSNSYWDVIIGTGKIWHEDNDGLWNRASFPLTLTDRWVGQARNCVATFVYKTDTISNICIQCSQETSDIDDKQLGNIKGILPATYQSKSFADSIQIVEQHNQSKSNRLPTQPLSVIDTNNYVAQYFEQKIYTNKF